MTHESLPNAEPTPEVASDAPVKEQRLGKLRLAFLYVLIGGLILSALISVFGILIGEFNSVIQKALLTTFIFVSHSLIVLALVSADTKNQIGRAILPTVILGVVLANMVTTTFGTWEIWDNEISWRALGLYTLLVGSAFLLAGVLKMRLAHPATLASVYTTVALLAIWTLLLTPWIFVDVELLDEFYFRLVGALTILTATALSLTAIIRRIAISQKPELKATVSAKEGYSGGMIAVLITVGSLTAFVWFIGFFVFLITAAQASYY